jgi:hypothetical protein
VNRLLRHKNHLRNCAIEARASTALYYSTATEVDVAAGSRGSTALCLSFDDNLISDCVSVAPQTPQVHTTAEPGDTLAVVCGFHFFDISPLHCGQIMMDQSPLGSTFDLKTCCRRILELRLHSISLREICGVDERETFSLRGQVY